MENVSKAGSPQATRKLSVVERASQAIRRASVHVIDQETFQMAMEFYEIGRKIGAGSSAIVYAAIYIPIRRYQKANHRNVAIKVIDLDMFERNQIDELRREIQIMSLSKHPNLLPV
jgi:serine/threonine protein kinase